MTPPALVVTPAELADYLGISDPTDAQLAVLAGALADAQSVVQGYLKWPIPPAEVTERGLWPYADGWHLAHGRVVAIGTPVAETYPDTTPTGYFTVTYTYGLDVATDPELEPIRRFILRSAADSPAVVRVWQAATGTVGAIKSASTDGQSITFETATVSGGGGVAGSGAPGAAPKLASLSYWRNREGTVYQRRVEVPQSPFSAWLGRW